MNAEGKTVLIITALFEGLGEVKSLSNSGDSLKFQQTAVECLICASTTETLSKTRKL